MDIENSISADIIKIKNKKEEIENIIKSVEDDLLKNILTMRYINGMRFENIAVECNYYIRHLYRLHERALDCVEIKKWQ